MVALYVTSSVKGGGKTAICAGLGKHLINNGKKIGFLKPVVTFKVDKPDSDAAFLKHLFALDEPLELLCPVISEGGNPSNKIKEAYAKNSQDKDTVIIEGFSIQNPVSRNIVEALNARVIIVEGYSKELSKSVNSYKNFGEHLLGVVLNKVPKNRVEQARTVLTNTGVNALGVLPEDRALFSLTVGELADLAQGEILNDKEKSSELVENFMLGALCVDPGPLYFGRKANKAAILKSERPDMQLAALETSTRCLVLTGKEKPKPVVLSYAKVKNVPVIVAKEELPNILTNIEDSLSKNKFNQESKLPRLTEIMVEQFNFPVVYKGLGLGA